MPAELDKYKITLASTFTSKKVNSRMENMEQVLKNELSRSEEEKKKRTFGIVNFLFMPSDVAIFLIN